jgi:hypothetical protein
MPLVLVSDTGGLDAVRDMLGNARTRDELDRHSFVFPEHRLLYVETPKAACTSMKVALLGLTESTLEDLEIGNLPRPFPEAIVHDRRVYPARSLADLDDDELAEVLTAPGWMRFCLVRGPFARTFSAWESKIFLGDAGMLDRFQPLGTEDRFHDGHLDVRATFCAFIENLVERRDFYFEDMHFRPQARVVAIGAVPYTDVVPLGDLDGFLPKLESHLGRLLVMARVNEGLGIPWQCNYDARAIELVAELYDEDIAQFGFPIPAPVEGPGTRLDAVATKLLSHVRMRVRQVAALHLASTKP